EAARGAPRIGECLQHVGPGESIGQHHVCDLRPGHRRRGRDGADQRQLPGTPGTRRPALQLLTDTFVQPRRARARRGLSTTLSGTMHVGRSGALLALALVAPAAAAQVAVPPLPRLALETFPSAARAAISRADREATAHAGDAQKAGTLARTLQAWEQWSAAHETYAR